MFWRNVSAKWHSSSQVTSDVEFSLVSRFQDFFFVYFLFISLSFLFCLMCPHGNDKWQFELHIGIFLPDRVFRGLRTRYNFPLFPRVFARSFPILQARCSPLSLFSTTSRNQHINYNSQLILSWPYTSIIYWHDKHVFLGQELLLEDKNRYCFSIENEKFKREFTRGQHFPSPCS